VFWVDGGPWHWVEEESDWTVEDYCSTAPPPAKRQKTGVVASLPLADLVNRRSASSVLRCKAHGGRAGGGVMPEKENREQRNGTTSAGFVPLESLVVVSEEDMSGW
jgi:hypothetical protein